MDDENQQDVNDEKTEIIPEKQELKEKIETEEEPCDPATMNCEEMRDKIVDLSDKRTQLEIYKHRIDEAKKLIPSPYLDKAFEEAQVAKKKIDDEIYNIFEKFTVCTTKNKDTSDAEV